MWVLSSTKATTKAKNVAATITGRNEASDGSELYPEKKVHAPL